MTSLHTCHLYPAQKVRKLDFDRQYFSNARIILFMFGIILKLELFSIQQYPN